jgi:hypothetical protein
MVCECMMLRDGEVGVVVCVVCGGFWWGVVVCDR